MDNDRLPKYSEVVSGEERRDHRRRNFRHRRRFIKVAIISLLAFLVYSQYRSNFPSTKSKSPLLSASRLQAEHAICGRLRSIVKDPSGSREVNARYITGQPATLIRNASIWTGEPMPGTSSDDAHAGKGWAWISGQDVLLEHGLIKKIAPTPLTVLPGVLVYDAQDRHLTAGIVDMHSHAGVESLPHLSANGDGNELSSDITPYVKSIDGFNPLDQHIQVIKSGGVTTSLILPGSGNNMGGEAYVIKHAVGPANGRSEISAESMLFAPEDRQWRYHKMACGENPKRVYGRLGRDFGPFSRMGESWYFRHAFEQAREVVRQQDDWCAAADSLGTDNMPSYLPQELEWESLAAVLRGQVLVNTHCYTVPDLETFVHHTNEFRFSIRAFHHAHQTYLVPEILKRAYNASPAYIGPPAAALFADNMYYKHEAYTGSEEAGAILYNASITPVYVSDNPVINAQHVVFEAAKAHGYGLPYHAALAGVTSEPARLLGLGERIGKVKEGWDADVVVWDSEPLSVGAAPRQVWIDGVAQFEKPVELEKGNTGPIGLDELVVAGGSNEDADFETVQDVVFSGVRKVLLTGYDEKMFGDDDSGYVVIRNGTLTCVGPCTEELSTAQAQGISTIHLRDGHLTSPATSFGSLLGLQEILLEESTRDGDNSEESFSAAGDGLSFTPKNLNAAYRHGVTKAIVAPSFEGGGHKGLSVGFRTGALMTGEKHAVWDAAVSLHYTLTFAAKQGKTPSLSSAVGAMKAKLVGALQKRGNVTDFSPLEEQCLDKVVKGEMAMVLTAHSADVIASILEMKAWVEKLGKTTIRLVIWGGAESWILADELAEAKVGVALAPLLAYSETWEQRRSLTGTPLTNGTAIDRLHDAGVNVAISTTGVGDWETRDLPLLAGWAHANGNHKISEKEAMAMISSNIFEMLGLKEHKEQTEREFVVWERSPLEIGGRVRAVGDGSGMIGLWK